MHHSSILGLYRLTERNNKWLRSRDALVWIHHWVLATRVARLFEILALAEPCIVFASLEFSRTIKIGPEMVSAGECAPAAGSAHDVALLRKTCHRYIFWDIAILIFQRLPLTIA
jgi:hypothetical protein